MIAATIGHYRLVELIAVGGMGVVYRGEDVALHRPVAIKLLSPHIAADEEYRARFLREARVAAALNHPNICTIYEVGEVEQTPFIAMELVEGETLAARLTREGRLSATDAIDVALQIADGLADAHAQHIVHRDLKPHNVMVARGGRVKIVDFGLAKPLAPAGKKAVMSTSDMISADLGNGTLVGTCAYMSPEQVLRKPIDRRSDLFSFGVMLYQMVTGQLPFPGDTSTEVLAKILASEPAEMPAIGGGVQPLARIIRRCLEKNPRDRYVDASDLAQQLKKARHLPSGRTRRVAVAVGLVCIVGAAYPLFRLVRSSEPPTTSPAATMTATPPAIAPQPAPDARLEDATIRTVPKPPPVQAPMDVRAVPEPTTIATIPPPPSGGTLQITSAPESSVSVDDKLLGVTPLSLDVSAGSHSLMLTSPDGLRWRGRVEIEPGRTTAINRNLAATGGLTIVSSTWVEVSLDRGPPEQTPIHFPSIAAGLHELRAFRDGYVTQTQDVFIEEGKTATVRLALEKRP
jgi:serine/threonine protein kinase